jgi:hypothetical protein
MTLATLCIRRWAHSIFQCLSCCFSIGAFIGPPFGPRVPSIKDLKPPKVCICFHLYLDFIFHIFKLLMSCNPWPLIVLYCWSRVAKHITTSDNCLFRFPRCVLCMRDENLYPFVYPSNIMNFIVIWSWLQQNRKNSTVFRICRLMNKTWLVTFKYNWMLY